MAAQHPVNTSPERVCATSNITPSSLGKEISQWQVGNRVQNVTQDSVFATMIVGVGDSVISARQPDAAMVRLTLQGSREAFDRLYDRHRVSAIRTARSIVSDEQQAEDLAQESFLEAFLCLKELRAPAAQEGVLRFGLCARRRRRTAG